MCFTRAQHRPQTASCSSSATSAVRTRLGVRCVRASAATLPHRRPGGLQLCTHVWRRSAAADVRGSPGSLSPLLQHPGKRGVRWPLRELLARAVRAPGRRRHRPLSEEELQLANTTRYFRTDCPDSTRNGTFSRGLQLRYGLLPPTLFRTGSPEATQLTGKVLLVHLNFLAAGANEKWQVGSQSHFTAAGYDANGPTRSLWGHGGAKSLPLAKPLRRKGVAER